MLNDCDNFTKEIVGGSLILFFKLLKLERAFLKMKLLLFLNEFFYLPIFSLIVNDDKEIYWKENSSNQDLSVEGKQN